MENKLKELRKKAGLSQKELAEKIGISNQAISFYESGKRKPKIEVWQKLADFFDVPVTYLQGTSAIKKNLSLEMIDYYFREHNRERAENQLKALSIVRDVYRETGRKMPSWAKQPEWNRLKDKVKCM